MSAAHRLAARVGWRPAHYLLILALHAHFITSGRKAADRDWSEYFYPLLDVVRLSIVKYHQFPWWDPWLLSGQPLFAEPQLALFMPDTLFTLAFGTVVGSKIIVIFYFFVGYEGTRFLCRELFGASRFLDAIAVIPVLVTPLALHFKEGHLVFVTFYLFPWLLALALSWRRSVRRSLAFGFVIGCYLLSYIHYTIIMSATIVAPLVLLGIAKDFRFADTWKKAGLVACTALGMAFARLSATWALVSRFPRTEIAHYPIAFPFDAIIGALIQPFRDETTAITHADLYWWELGSYVGVCALVLAYEGFRRGERRFWPLYAGAVLCLALAFNNRDRWYPSYWLHFVPPWNYMLVITRWRLFGCFFILVGCVHGLLGLRRQGWHRLAMLLAAFTVTDLGYHVAYGYARMYAVDEPPFSKVPDPPKTVVDQVTDTWADVRANLVSEGALSTLLGYGSHSPARMRTSDPGYRGEFVGRMPVQVVTWTPNRIVLLGTPGDTVTLNVNPSSYWLMNGVRLFPEYRPLEIEKPFQVTVPQGGRMEFLARPPHWQVLFAVQGLFAVAAAVLYWTMTKSSARLEVRPALSARPS